MRSERGYQTGPATLITDKITDRETDILRLLARGLSNADISERLSRSEGTVRNHVSAILAKLYVTGFYNNVPLFLFIRLNYG
jgi:DNA-binding NarL/FixJ family response regulator